MKPLSLKPLRRKQPGLDWFSPSTTEHPAAAKHPRLEETGLVGSVTAQRTPCGAVVRRTTRTTSFLSAGSRDIEREKYLEVVCLRLVHGQRVVQAQREAEVAQAAGQVALHQDVGALDVPVRDGHLVAAARRVVAVEVRHAERQRAAQLPQVVPADHVVDQELLQVPPRVEGRDQPALPLRLPVLRRQEVEHVVVPQVRVREDVLLVLPGGVLLVLEDLDGHRLEALLLAARRAPLQLGLVDLGEAPFAHLELQLDGQQLRVVVEVVGVRGAAVRALVVDHDGVRVAEVQAAPLALGAGLPLPVDPVAVEGGDDHDGHEQQRHQAHQDDRHHLGVHV
ncbi:hypothetical protein EYF80_054915 [Liparis tanakae]|uniref:Uncharacterized protein n=1 Tax=Liparis tanakae TaxID=230148 RepID=A0A4Z2F349_9TELE|nr:hypothetical protein EYF80_054915 [Liparis tanakae]